MSNDNQPHYIIAPTVSDWHSEAYPTRQAAQTWLDNYLVTADYKERTYKIVPVAEYWERRTR